MHVLQLSLDRGTYGIIDTEENGHALDLALRLYSEHEMERPVVIVAPSASAAEYQGSSFFTVIYRSPVTSSVALAFSNLPPGYSLRRLGYDVVLITGRASRLTAVALDSGYAAFIPADVYASMSADEFGRAVSESPTDVYLAIGRAGENSVYYASVISDGREIPSDGLGYEFGGKNLKGITLPGFRQSAVSGREGYCRGRSKALKALRQEGDGSMIGSALRLGWLPVNGYTDRFDPRARFLDGKAITEKYGIFPETCQDCTVACRRKTSDGRRIPSWRESAFLGTNLGLFSPESVMRLSDAALEEGLDTVYLGAVLSGISSDSQSGKPSSERVDEYVRMIHMIGRGMDYERKFSRGITGIKAGDGRPVPSDLRGSFPDAIAVAFSFPVFPSASDYVPEKALKAESAAIMALYECVYSLYLVSEGYSPFPALVAWLSRLPSSACGCPGLLRSYMLSFRAYGIRGRDMLSRGYELLSMFSSDKPSDLPDRFVSEFNEGAVPAVRLFSYFRKERSLLEKRLNRQKERLSRISEERREKMEMPSSESSAAVGPDDDLGRDGEPGLQK